MTPAVVSMICERNLYITNVLFSDIFMVNSSMASQGTDKFEILLAIYKPAGY